MKIQGPPSLQQQPSPPRRGRQFASPSSKAAARPRNLPPAAGLSGPPNENRGSLYKVPRPGAPKQSSAVGSSPMRTLGQNKPDGKSPSHRDMTSRIPIVDTSASGSRRSIKVLGSGKTNCPVPSKTCGGRTTPVLWNVAIATASQAERKNIRFIPVAPVTHPQYNGSGSIDCA